MPMRLENYCSPEEWDKIQEFSKDKETPFLVVDLEVIRQKYQ